MRLDIWILNWFRSPTSGLEGLVTSHGFGMVQTHPDHVTRGLSELEGPASQCHQHMVLVPCSVSIKSCLGCQVSSLKPNTSTLNPALWGRASKQTFCGRAQLTGLRGLRCLLPWQCSVRGGSTT